MDPMFESKLKAIVSGITSLKWSPSRVLVSPALYQVAREAVVMTVNVGDFPITLRAHPRVPDDMVIMFGANGTFQVCKLEEST